MMNFIFGFTILLLFQFVGTTLSQLLHLPLPGSLAGLVLLAIALATGLLPMHFIEQTANALLSEMSLFFIPAGVGLILYADLLFQNSVAIILTVLISTLIVLCLTGKIVDQVLPNPDKKVTPSD
ncbi:Holin-like protein CidA [Sporomusa silvacetica DSM 10669]|uniref:Holin-like protein CidA n=1 Tax=Sporomusa silvacetica DSM 10669 TaxID=1123289 RepID=A0ABZ3IVD6_9FIRM|nr:CidA/LrgA family protein [Sporomusa silvacetica]OZC12995.1 holin-like protein CidA [Sporomusa silvacetica DSM 10669]